MARFSNLWDEAEHPRDRLGRFRSKWKIGGKAKAIVDSILDRFQPRQFPDYQRANNYGVERGWSRYTPAQKKSITDYVRLNSRAVNAELRNGKESPESKSIDEAMHPLEDDVILTRSLGPQAFGLSPNDIQATEELTGKLVSDAAYTNAWMGGPARNGGVTMHILAPRGTPAVFPGGAEVMLGRHQPLRITRAEQDGAGGMRLYAVAVPHTAERPMVDKTNLIRAGSAEGNVEAVAQSKEGKKLPIEQLGPIPEADQSIPERVTANPRAGEIAPSGTPARSLGDTPSGVEEDGRPSWTVGNEPIVVSPAIAGGGGLKVTAGKKVLIQDAPDMESLGVEASRAGLPEVANWAKANQRHVNSKDAPAAADRAAKRAAAARQLKAAQEPEAPASAPSAPEGSSPSPQAAPAPSAVPAGQPAQPVAAPTTPTTANPEPVAANPPAPTPSSSPQVPVDVNQPESPNATPEERAARAEVRRNAEQDAQAQGLAPAAAAPTPQPAATPDTSVPTSPNAAPSSGAPAPSPTPAAEPSRSPKKTVPSSPQSATTGTSTLRRKATSAGIKIPKEAKTKQQVMEAVVDGLLEKQGKERKPVSTARKVAEPQKTTLAEREAKVREAATPKLGPPRAVEPAQKSTLAEREAKVGKAPSTNLPPAKVAPKKKTTVEERTKAISEQRDQDLANDVANKEQRDRWSEQLGGEPKGLSKVQDLTLDSVAEDLRSRKTTRAKASERLRDLSRGYKDEDSEQNKYLRSVADAIEADTSKLPARIVKKRAPKPAPDVDAAEAKLAGRTERNILTGISGLPVGDVRALADKWGVETRGEDKKLKLKADLVRELAAKWKSTPALQRKKEGASTVPAKAAAPEVKAAVEEIATPAAKKAVARLSPEDRVAAHLLQKIGERDPAVRAEILDSLPSEDKKRIVGIAEKVAPKTGASSVPAEVAATKALRKPARKAVAKPVEKAAPAEKAVPAEVAATKALRAPARKATAPALTPKPASKVAPKVATAAKARTSAVEKEVSAAQERVDTLERRLANAERGSEDADRLSEDLDLAREELDQAKEGLKAKPSASKTSSRGPQHTRAELMDMSPSELKSIEDELNLERPSLLKEDRVKAILARQRLGAAKA